MAREEFRRAYDSVFDANGDIKACGRAATKNLIEISDRLEPGTIHGNPDTGVMDVGAIQALKQKL